MNARDSNASSETTMTKIIIVQSVDINFSQSFQVDIPYDSHHRQLDLGHSLHHILHNILSLTSQQQIFYFHPIQQLFEYAGLFPFQYPLLIGEDFIALQEITVRIRRLPSQSEPEEERPKESKQTMEKKKRVGQRTIREVLAKVSEWRQITHKNPKITLEEGAKMVGIPKKSLDDYYGHIKLGSEYKFDFQHNLEQKIGVLRSFVKENNSKKKESSEFSFLNLICKEEGEIDSDQEQQQE